MDVIYIIRPEAVFIGGKIAVLGDALIQSIINAREMILMYLFRNQKVDVKLSEISEYAANN
jgi:predicted NBD/HSP70 family sugar kinase